MEPAQITALINSMATLIGVTGTTPFITLFLGALLVPWLVLVLVSISQHRRFESVVTMYNNNFQQVEVTQGLARDYQNLARDERELVIMTSTAMTNMHAAIENNMYCPIVRKNAKPKDIHNEQ
jgi:hypothetical protein